MSKHWQPSRTGWMSADAYAALSPAQRRSLWLERKAAGRGFARTVRQPRRRKGYFLRRKLLVIACLLATMAFLKATDVLVSWWLNPAPTAAIETAPEAVPAAPASTASPAAEVDPADEEWAARGEGREAAGRASGARNDGVRASFGHCHSGGGSNCVVDGDTFYIGGAKVRIAGIDAPETHDYRCASELALGNQATAQLQALLNSGAVTMTGIGRDRDAYGRLLRNVAVDGQDVGEALMAAGVARAYGSGRRSWCS